MILAFPVLIAVVGLTFWAFYRFSPKGAATFNRITLVLCIGLTVYEFWRIHRELQGTPDAGWWPVVASLRSVFFIVVLLGTMTLIRIVLFRAGKSKSVD